MVGGGGGGGAALQCDLHVMVLPGSLHVHAHVVCLLTIYAANVDFVHVHSTTCVCMSITVMRTHHQ